MKVIIYKLFLIVLLLSGNSMIFSQTPPPIYFNPPDYYIGDVWGGDDISFEFQVLYDLSTPHDYVIKVQDVILEQPWVNAIAPDYFNFSSFGESRYVVIQGHVDPGEMTYGMHTFTIKFYPWPGTPEQLSVAEYSISYNFLGYPGTEDYVQIISGTSSFSEGDFLGYEAHFYDLNPLGDLIVEWNLKIKLFDSFGEYTYIDLTTQGSINYWNFIAPEIPNNRFFTRNENGQIHGVLTVTGLDSDGINHTDDMVIGINKEPDKPFLYPQQFNNSSVKLIYNSLGANDYYIYYDTDPNPPYNGTGLIQGNSPIHVGSQTQFELDGLQNCTPYYFAIKAGNSDGLSVFSDEVSITVFEPSNYQSVNVNLFDLVIPEDTQIDENFYFAGNLIIESGATVELNGGIMYFEENSKIIIEPGGKLTLDGATCAGVCGQTWQGIEVWGNYSQHQYTINGQNAQGQLILMNDAVIENAVSAVELWKPNDYTKTGGIVQATDAVFRNNTKSIHAISYTNFSPFIPGRETDNVSYFNNCVFELNEDYIPGHTFYKHADLDRVKGIKFRGCDFTVTPVEGVSYWNSAIASYSAGFGVEAICTSNTIPCSEYDKCTFTGFNSAIHATASPSNTRTFSVSRAVFNDNIYGVQVETVNNFSVLFSDFFIGHNAIDEDECEGTDLTAAGYGISSSNSTGFAIEENYFTKTTGAPAGNYVGIRIAETQAADQVYLNSFENLSYANYTEGQNWRANYTWEGLAFYCNHNTNNYADFYVANGDNSGIQSLQGDDDQVAGNTFSSSGATWHFYNGGNHLVGYYYCTYCPDENPDNRKTFHVVDQGEDLANSCLSHYGGTNNEGETLSLVLSPEQALETEQRYAASLTDYNNVKMLYDNLKDGGNTEVLKEEVEAAWPNDMWELRGELLGKSPHLSLEVLKMAADKTDVLPDAVLFEILAANPDELKKEELLTYLEDKENPLPGYMIEILRQVAGGTTYKTVLEQQMARYNQAKTRAAYDVIRSILNDSIANPDELRNWLDNLGGLRADEQIIASYVQEENFEDALTLAGMLPQLYSDDNCSMEEYNLYMEMLNLEIQLRQEGRDIGELDSTEVGNLVIVAETSHGTAGSIARGILVTQYGHHFCDCLSTSGNEGFKSSQVYITDAFNKMFGGEIEINPNPAKEWTSIGYTMPDSETEGIIKISDVNGNIVQTFTVSGKQGTNIWDTRKTKPGIYFYEFVVNGYSNTGKIIVNN